MTWCAEGAWQLPSAKQRRAGNVSSLHFQSTWAAVSRKHVLLGIVRKHTWAQMHAFLLAAEEHPVPQQSCSGQGKSWAPLVLQTLGSGSLKDSYQYFNFKISMKCFSKNATALSTGIISWFFFFFKENSFWCWGTRLFRKKSSRGLLKIDLKLRRRIKRCHPFPSPLSQAGVQEEGRARGPPCPFHAGLRACVGPGGARTRTWELHAASAFVHVCVKHRLGFPEINACLQMARKMPKCHWNIPYLLLTIIIFSMIIIQ